MERWCMQWLERWRMPTADHQSAVNPTRKVKMMRGGKGVRVACINRHVEALCHCLLETAAITLQHMYTAPTVAMYYVRVEVLQERCRVVQARIS